MFKHLCCVYYSHLHWGQTPQTVTEIWLSPTHGSCLKLYSWGQYCPCTHTPILLTYQPDDWTVCEAAPELVHFLTQWKQKQKLVNQPGILKWTQIVSHNIDMQTAVVHTLLQTLLLRSSDLGRGTVWREGNFTSSPSNFNLLLQESRSSRNFGATLLQLSWASVSMVLHLCCQQTLFCTGETPGLSLVKPPRDIASGRQPQNLIP